MRYGPSVSPGRGFMNQSKSYSRGSWFCRSLDWTVPPLEHVDPEIPTTLGTLDAIHLAAARRRSTRGMRPHDALLVGSIRASMPR